MLDDLYFDDVTESNWASVKLLKGSLSAEEVRSTIINEMNDYNKN
jgi:hypothetical protein